MTGTPRLTQVNMTSLEFINKDLTVSNTGLPNLDFLSKVKSSSARVAVLDNPSMQKIRLYCSNLEDLQIHNNNPLATINLPALRYVNRAFSISEASYIYSPVDFVGGLFNLSNNFLSSMKGLELRTAGGFLIANNSLLQDFNAAITTINSYVPDIENSYESMVISGNPVLREMSASSLRSVTGGVLMENNPLLRSLNIASLKYATKVNITGILERQAVFNPRSIYVANISLAHQAMALKT